MAEKIIQNPSITPNDFGYDGGAISSILGAPLVGAGGGTIIESDFVWLPSVTNEGVISWQRATSATAPSTANIMGPQGNPGQNGTNGTNGTNGYSVELQSVTDEDGGKKVTLSWGETPSTSSFVIPSGAKGADGQKGVDGISPTFTTSVTSDEQHPQGGTHVVISGAAGESAFNVWNGIDGEGATVNLFGNNGVSVTKDGTNYAVGLSGGYYSDTLSAYSAMYAGYASNAKFSDNSVSSMDQIKGSIDDGNQVAYATSANLYNASAKWDAVSAKSHTTIDGNQVITTENNGTSATVSAVQYVTNVGFSTAPKQLFVCQDDNDLTAHLDICQGKGTLFFVCSAI